MAQILGFIGFTVGILAKQRDAVGSGTSRGCNNPGTFADSAGQRPGYQKAADVYTRDFYLLLSQRWLKFHFSPRSSPLENFSLYSALTMLLSEYVI